VFWTLQTLKDSENKQYKLHHGSIFSAARVFSLSRAPTPKQVLESSLQDTFMMITIILIFQPCNAINTRFKSEKKI
jgi:hypothetical protein